jgi:hypothetical protein
MWLLTLAFVPALMPTPLAPTPRTRQELRVELLDALELGSQTPQASHLMVGRVEELVKELELLEAVPATSEFTMLGTAGDWTLRTYSPPEGALPPSASDVKLSVDEVTQHIDAEGLLGRSAVLFRCEGMRGTYSVEHGINANSDMTGREDTVHLVASGRQLSLPRAPSCGVEQLMIELHAQLPYDFLSDEGVRLSMQTTYLDESLRITRCTTRSLAGACAVHVRTMCAGGRPLQGPLSELSD